MAQDGRMEDGSQTAPRWLARLVRPARRLRRGRRDSAPALSFSPHRSVALKLWFDQCTNEPPGPGQPANSQRRTEAAPRGIVSPARNKVGQRTTSVLRSPFLPGLERAAFSSFPLASRSRSTQNYTAEEESRTSKAEGVVRCNRCGGPTVLARPGHHVVLFVLWFLGKGFEAFSRLQFFHIRYPVRCTSWYEYMHSRVLLLVELGIRTPSTRQTIQGLSVWMSVCTAWPGTDYVGCSSILRKKRSLLASRRLCGTYAVAI